MSDRSLYSEKLMEIYFDLYNQIGPRKWWPADSPFEVVIGAILTQNTAWINVKKAIENLKNRDLLYPKSLLNIAVEDLAKLIRPSGYYNQKAQKIKSFLDYFFSSYSGSIDLMIKQEIDILREELLAVNGIGPETADSILLYALEKPIFVVDSYTRRIFFRHGWFHEKISYEEMQNFFMNLLEKNVALFNEFHAQIDYVGHFYCKKKPICDSCPLLKHLPEEDQLAADTVFSFKNPSFGENR